MGEIREVSWNPILLGVFHVSTKDEIFIYSMEENISLEDFIPLNLKPRIGACWGFGNTLSVFSEK